MNTEKDQREAEALLAKLSPKKQATVRWVMQTYGHTLAEALAELRAFGGL
jgi:hypothetical protein